MTAPSDVAEREFFHGSPATALPLLRAAAGAEPRAAWLLGAALGALGRYGEAKAQLTAVLDGGGNGGAAPYGSLAASTLASHYRQLGRHQDAHEWDERALMSAGSDAEAEFDARLGLAADAVGTGDLAAARAGLGAAARAGVAAGAVASSGAGVGSAVDPGWRRRVRLGWVETEVALLAGDPARAVESARAGLAVAEDAAAPRHVAKCLLFLGVARHVLADAEPPERALAEPPESARAEPPERARAEPADRAVDDLLIEAGRAADAVGALPLRWVSAAVLAERADCRDESDLALIHRHVAAAAILKIGAGLPEPDQIRWLGRVDIAAIVSLSA